MFLDSIKNYVKSRPWLYDRIDARRPIRTATQRWLQSFTSRHGPRISFLQIGASDGLRWDPLRRFIVRYEWTGVLVEPIPPVFDLLRSNYAYLHDLDLTFVNAAVSATSTDHIGIWTISEWFRDQLDLEEQLYYLRQSSMDRTHVARVIDRHLNVRDEEAKKYVTCHRVPCVTMEDLMSHHWRGRHLDLICIDAEGHDDHIVRSIDLQRVQPKAILYESHNLADRKDELEQYLHARGFNTRELDGDTVAEARSSRVADPATQP